MFIFTFMLVLGSQTPTGSLMQTLAPTTPAHYTLHPRSVVPLSIHVHSTISNKESIYVKKLHRACIYNYEFPALVDENIFFCREPKVIAVSQYRLLCMW